MRTYILLLVVFLSQMPLAVASSENTKTSQLRPVNTYSIVARDEKTGEMGVAVQSHWFSVGSLVPWAEAGVGAVATQSFIEVRYGVSGLKLMRDGWSAPKTLSALLALDPHIDVRQVAMIDVNGNVAAHTGDSCIEYADHKTGKNYSVQANLMLEKGVVDAMETAFLKSADQPLAQRLLLALDAAQAKGGDARGKQSAAILVVKGKSSGRPWEDRTVDLHVEDHPHPVKELRRLFLLQTAYGHMNKGDLAIEENNLKSAMIEYGKAEALFPENEEMKFWHAVSLVNANRVEEALPLFRQIFRKNNNWRILVRRLFNSDILKNDEKVIEKIISLSP